MSKDSPLVTADDRPNKGPEELGEELLITRHLRQNKQPIVEEYPDFSPASHTKSSHNPFMIRRLWLLFAQVTTVALALLFVLATLRPDWLASDPMPSQAGGALLSGIAPSPAGPMAASGGDLPSYRQAAARAMPAVVYVFSRQSRQSFRHPLYDDPLLRRFFGEPPEDESRDRNPRGSGLGSGVIVSSDGYVLTNHHVIEGADQVQVSLSDGRKASARIVGTDPETDLAVLRIRLENLPVIEFGEPSALRVGDPVLAIGNPFGVGLTVTQGIVSALGRKQLNINTFENFIQTDAAINPGNSGGALVDSQGKLVGINTAIYSRDGGNLGIGFAISADMAQQVMQSLIKSGKVSRGFIGVELQDVNAAIAESLSLPTAEGSIVASLQPGGPADKAGMKVGDVIVAVNQAPSRNTAELLSLVAALSPGDKAKIEVLRNGERTGLELTVAERPRRD
jgi:serine protease DegQ